MIKYHFVKESDFKINHKNNVKKTLIVVCKITLQIRCTEGAMHKSKVYLKGLHKDPLHTVEIESYELKKRYQFLEVQNHS